MSSEGKEEEGRGPAGDAARVIVKKVVNIKNKCGCFFAFFYLFFKIKTKIKFSLH